MHRFAAIGVLKLELESKNAQFWSNSTIFRAVWTWNLMGDLGKHKGTSSMLLRALCVISEPLVNSKWSYSPETTNLGQIRYLEPCDIAIWRTTLKTIGNIFYVTSSFMHNFVAIGEFKLELQSGNTQFGSNLTILRAAWPWNLTDDLENQKGTSSTLHQALCIIS